MLLPMNEVNEVSVNDIIYRWPRWKYHIAMYIYYIYIAHIDIPQKLQEIKIGRVIREVAHFCILRLIKFSKQEKEPSYHEFSFTNTEFSPYTQLSAFCELWISKTIEVEC